AHEAIRPTYIDQEQISGTAQEKKLYDLIWKRTLASQMADAELEKTTLTIDISTSSEKFVATGEVIIFDGFLTVYLESTDDDNGSQGGEALIPPLKAKDVLISKSIQAVQRFSQRPPRYTEASLVKRLEELGIGRPSTYAPTITTIQNRNYVVKEDRQGMERQFVQLDLSKGQIRESVKTEVTGTEKSKLFPTDIGIVVTDFLLEYFEQIMDYNFTAKVEAEFDEIAEGKRVWSEVIDEFYHPFHQKIDNALKNSEKTKGERLLGTDPVSGKPVYVKIGRFGPIAQLGIAIPDSDEEKPQFASLRSGQHLETITLDDALDLFKMPRDLGEFENKKVTIGIGRFGPYVRHNNLFVSLAKTDDPYTVDLERAIELIEQKREKDRNSLIRVFEQDPELKILNGRWGPYLSYKKTNVRLPKGKKAEDLTFEECIELVSKAPSTPKRKKK
ncbi:MAG TPA: DNA topoisomerase I, partial [Prolixibacteraceae bacterium]|nr:DNA topoisomerase I [Prolixibacteraceae bacterium]